MADWTRLGWVMCRDCQDPERYRGTGSMDLADQVQIPATAATATPAPPIGNRGIAPVPIGQGSAQVRRERHRQAFTGLVKCPRSLYLSTEPWITLVGVHDGARRAWA